MYRFYKLINKFKRNKVKEVNIKEAYYNLLGSTYARVIVSDLIDCFDPVSELHTPNDPYTSAYNNGTVAPIKYILSRIEEAENRNTNRPNTSDNTEGDIE